MNHSNFLLDHSDPDYSVLQVKAGDVLVAVNNQDVVGQNLEDLHRLVAGGLDSQARPPTNKTVGARPPTYKTVS